MSPLIDSFSGAVTFLTSTCLLKYGYWLLKVMSESLKRVEIFFFIDALILTRVVAQGRHKKGGIPARLQILVKIKFEATKKELEKR